MGGGGAPEREITRLALHVIRGENLWTTAGYVADTQVVISIIKSDGSVVFKTTSRVVRAESSPEWQLSSVMDLPYAQPLDSTIHIEVVKVPQLKIGFRRSMCVYSSDISNLLDQAKLMPNTMLQESGSEPENTALSDPFWLDCQHKGHRRGRLLVQAQYINRIEAKPIRVLVLTWNLGNASPSPAFSSCFPDSEMGAYDLIVVGTQESAYSAPSRHSTAGSGAPFIAPALAAAGDISPELSVISDAMTDTGRILGRDDEDDDAQAEGGGGEEDDDDLDGGSTPFYLDDSPEATNSLMSESPVEWRSARSAHTPRSSEVAMHADAMSAGALSEGVEAVGGVEAAWPPAAPSGDLDEAWLEGGLPHLTAGARSVYVDEAGTVHYANANGAFPTLPPVSESAEVGEVDDGGAFVDGGGNSFGRVAEAAAAAEAAVAEVDAGAGSGAPPMPGRIKSERSLNVMPPVPEESEGALEDSTRRLSSSDARSSGDISGNQNTGDLSADIEADTVSLPEVGAAGRLPPAAADVAEAAGPGWGGTRLGPHGVGAGRGAVVIVPNGAGRSLGEGRGRLVLGAQERAAEWLDSAALPSLGRHADALASETAAPESPPAAEPLDPPRLPSLGAGPVMSPMTRGSGSGSGSGSAGQWEMVRLSDAMQAAPAGPPVPAGMLGALPLSLMRERSVTDISLGNLSEPWASGYTPSYPPSSTEITPSATVIGSEYGGRDDAADTQELATISPVAAAPTSHIVSTSNTAPNTLQLLTSYPYLAELSTTAGDGDGDAWLAHTSSSGAAAGGDSRDDGGRVEAAAAQHARSQARAQTRRTPRSGSMVAAAVAAIAASADEPPLDSMRSTRSADKIGQHLDGHDIVVDSAMYSTSSFCEDAAPEPPPRHMWDETASAPLQMSHAVVAAAAQPGAEMQDDSAADAVSVPLMMRQSRAEGRDAGPRRAGLSLASPKLPMRKKGRPAEHAAAVAQLERMLEESPRGVGDRARDAISRHAAAGAVVARAAFERARSASPLGAAGRGRRAVAAATSASNDSDIASARDMAREQAALARSTASRGWSGRGRPAAVHSPSPDTTARNRTPRSTPAATARLFTQQASFCTSPDRTPTMRSPSRTRLSTTLPDSLHAWAGRPRSGPATLQSSPSGDGTNVTTSASSIPLFKAPPSPSSAPTPSMSAFTTNLPLDADTGGSGGGGGGSTPAYGGPAPSSSNMVDSSGPVTANPSLSFTDFPLPAAPAGDTHASNHVSGTTVFYTAMEPASRSGHMSDRGSTRTSDAMSEPRFERGGDETSSGAATGSMPSLPGSPAAVEMLALAPEDAAASPHVHPAATSSDAPVPQPDVDAGSPLATVSTSATGAVPPPITGDDSLLDLHMHAMRDISLGGVSSTGPSDALHDSITPTASVQGATLATWVHTSGRSSLSPPPSIQVPESSITLPAVPASMAVMLIGSSIAPVPSEPELGGAAGGATLPVQTAAPPFDGPNPTAPDALAAYGEGDTANASPLAPQHSGSDGSARGAGGSDGLNPSTSTLQGPASHTASTAHGEGFGHTTSSAQGSCTSPTSGAVAEGPNADRMLSAGSGRGRASLDLASVSVSRSVSHDAVEMGASSLVLTATRSSGITVFRGTAAPAAPRPSTAPEPDAAASLPTRGVPAGKPPLPDAAQAGATARGSAASSPLPPLGPSQAAAKQRRGDVSATVVSPISPASGSTPTGASTTSPTIGAAHMHDGDHGLQRTSLGSSTQMASRPLSGVSAATSEITRDISPVSSTPVVMEPMPEMVQDMQLPIKGWQAAQLDAAPPDSMLRAAPAAPASPVQEAQQSARSVASGSHLREGRALEASPDTSLGPTTSTRDSAASNMVTPRPSATETDTFGNYTTMTPEDSAASQPPYRLFSRAWRGLVNSSGSFRRSFSPKGTSATPAAPTVITSVARSSMSATGGGSSAGPRADFTLVAARELRGLTSSPSPSMASERGTATAHGSGRTPSGRALAAAVSAVPEVSHTRMDSWGSGRLSAAALPVAIGEAGEQIGRVPPAGGAELPWHDVVAAAVNAGAPHTAMASYEAPYAVWKHASMGQMRLVVLARRDVMTLLGSASTASVATGVAGVGSNKGAVAISCQVWGTEICFVNSHLAAHQSRVAERNKMFRTIARELRLRPTGEALLSSFHHVFFLGDLNYRLNYGGPLDYRDGSPGDALASRFQKDLRHAHESGSYDALLAHDQLRAMQLTGKAFVDFHEADISYPPTFKVEREASIVYKPHRLPAWCDRILWHTNMPAGMHPVCTGYFMVAEADSSDHKPVAAVFTLPSVLSPAHIVTDSIENFVVSISNLRARDLLERKMHSRVRKHVAKLRLRPFTLPTLRRSSGIRLRVHGDDFHHPAKATSSSAAAAVEWKHELKLNCKHAYVEHIRGRMLRFKLSFETGRRRSRRTIAQGALPLMTVLPAAMQASPQWPAQREEWPFSIPLYHGGLKAGELTGKIRWSVRRNDPFSRLALSRVSRIGRVSDS
eukprot:jgi/Ulvmu1/2340/UM013_0188.1